MVQANSAARLERSTRKNNSNALAKLSEQTLRQAGREQKSARLASGLKPKLRSARSRSCNLTKQTRYDLSAIHASARQLFATSFETARPIERSTAKEVAARSRR